MMTILISILCIVGYIIIAGIIFGICYYLNSPSDEDEQSYTAWTWPISLIYILCASIFELSGKTVIRLLKKFNL